MHGSLVAVVEPAACYRQGLAAALEKAGFCLVEPERLKQAQAQAALRDHSHRKMAWVINQSSLRDPAFDAPPELSAADLRALHALGNGVTVAELADREASSERDMYRQLQRIWLRLGVNNRNAAMVRAVKLGLLD